MSGFHRAISIADELFISQPKVYSHTGRLFAIGFGQRELAPGIRHGGNTKDAERVSE